MCVVIPRRGPKANYVKATSWEIIYSLNQTAISSVYQSMYGQQGLQSPPPPPKPTTYSQYPYMSSPTSNLQQQQQPNLPYQSPPPQNYYNYR